MTKLYKFIIIVYWNGTGTNYWPTGTKQDKNSLCNKKTD